jgi:outer membrane protein
VTTEQRLAAARLDAARAIAANTPIQFAAARQTESQARARYDAGLATVIEVADAQGLLAASEYEDRLARIATWQALLDAALARGELAPFLTAIRSGSGQ